VVRRIFTTEDTEDPEEEKAKKGTSSSLLRDLCALRGGSLVHHRGHEGIKTFEVLENLEGLTSW